jgi:hypothetical protein
MPSFVGSAREGEIEWEGVVASNPGTRRRRKKLHSSFPSVFRIKTLELLRAQP